MATSTSPPLFDEDIPQVFLEEVLCKNQEIVPLATRSLMGKIICDKVLNFEAAAKELMFKVWSSYSGLQISEQGKNQFLISFNKEQDAIEVMSGAPWFVMNHLLCLEFWSPEYSGDEISFRKSPFWIQIHNLHMEYMNISNATVLLMKLGDVLEVENPIHGGKLLRNFIRGRVKLYLDKPLPAGCWIQRKGMPSLWVNYKYERLQSLCYNCGIIGHDEESCQNPLAFAHYHPCKPKYGPHSCVGAPTSIHFLSHDPNTMPEFPIETEEEKRTNKHYYDLAKKFAK